MNKVKLVVVLCFILALAAGGVGGYAFSRRSGTPEPESWLGRELNLTPEQEKQMREIWSSHSGSSRDARRQQRRELEQEREEAIRELLDEKQTKQYEEIVRSFREKSDAMSEERRKAFEQAVERTKLILTEEQRTKYEELLKRRPSRRHGTSPARRDGGGRQKPARSDKPEAGAEPAATD